MRRYLGCKTRLLPHIADVARKHCPDCRSVFDVFAGTGVVGHMFNKGGRAIIVNDFLASNYTVLYPWFCALPEDRPAIEETIAYLQTLSPADASDYYAAEYGNRFFTMETARTIGAIRAAIEDLALRPVVKCAAIASLIYAADKVALTCGHFDAYRGLKDKTAPFRLRLPRIPYRSNKRNKAFCKDGNLLVNEVQADLMYVDPPYNSRQYGTLYHALENITHHDKPELFGKTRKMALDKRPNSRYCTRRAQDAMADLISGAQVKHIIVSYNNMSSGVYNSNALITRQDFHDILAQKGDVTLYTHHFPSFIARRGQVQDHKEYLFYCRVT